MIREPNHEQKRAIDHLGGVVLQAGAGSGKTYVLVEHFISYLNEKKSELLGTSDEETRLKIKTFLSSMVIMTFTKKATAEIKGRLISRLNLEISRDPFFVHCKDEIDFLNVSTIHGFCSKLISSGNIPELPSDYELVNENQLRHKLEKGFRYWLGLNKSELSEADLYQGFLRNSDALVDSLTKIFASPELRMMWLEGSTSPKNFSEQSFKSDIEELLSLKGLENIKASLESLDSKDLEKPWAIYLLEFSTLFESCGYIGEDLEKYISFFENYSGLRAPRKSEKYEGIIGLIDDTKKLRKFVKDNGEGLSGFKGNLDIIENWQGWISRLVSFVEEIYLFDHSYSYADLEYYVLKTLRENPENKISSLFHYFIVDEFQDTSHVQFEILERLVKSDFSKVFYIGDIKQAIYGFRGGELDVFLKSFDLVPLNLELANNYRSSRKVIEFNNELHSKIFPLGQGFAGNAPQIVPFHKQKVPEASDKGEGKLTSYHLNVESEESKVTSSMMDEYESLQILGIIQEKLQEKGDICILYRKLSPSKSLIPRMIQEDISFKAQVKIPRHEDPVLSIAYLMLENYLADLSPEDQIRLSSLLLNKYFDYLNLNSKANFTKIIKEFYSSYKTLGLKDSFNKFFLELGLSNSNSSNNIKELNEVIEMANADPGKTLSSLDRLKSDTYSIDYSYGVNPRVTLMTVHASKGLEFDHVILGGIHTNGGSRADVNYQGDLPLSFKYKTSENQKKALKTPSLILEELLKKQKEFSESKRLFYVASTRAIDSISWVELYRKGKLLSYSSSSWIHALIKYQEECECKELIELKSNELEVKSGEKRDTRPLFHTDKMGLNHVALGMKVGLSAEVSVSSLSSLALCPRMFYLKNICKFSGDEFELQKDLFSEQPISSAERGTYLHFIIEDTIKNDFSIRKNLSSSDRDLVNWCLSKLETLNKSHELICEKELKFSLFGQMITGIPDLVALPKDQSGDIHIWDYKTGKRKEDSEDNYWFQLYVYAFAYSKILNLHESSKVNLVLCYLDEKNNLEQSISISEIQEKVFKTWSMLGHLDQVNKSHCHNCQYRAFCS